MKRKPNPDVIEIVRQYLIEHDFDGLYSEIECVCTIDDLAPCGQIEGVCIAGYKVKCTCKWLHGGHDFHIQESKRGRIKK